MSAEERKPNPCEFVVLDDLPQGFSGGLPIEDQHAISEVVGKPVRLSGYDSDGRAELEFTDRKGITHFIYVDSGYIRTTDH
jgi:hypothetical protein